MTKSARSIAFKPHPSNRASPFCRPGRADDERAGAGTRLFRFTDGQAAGGVSGSYGAKKYQISRSTREAPQGRLAMRLRELRKFPPAPVAKKSVCPVSRGSPLLASGKARPDLQAALQRQRHRRALGDLGHAL